MSLWDDLRLAGAVAQDLVSNLNPWSLVVPEWTGGAGFLSGDAPNTAREAERQNAEAEGREFSWERADASATGGLSTVWEATTDTADQVTAKVETVVNDAGELAKKAGGALEFFTTPFGILAGVAGAVMLLVVLPAAVEGWVKK